MTGGDSEESGGSEPEPSADELSEPELDVWESREPVSGGSGGTNNTPGSKEIASGSEFEEKPLKTSNVMKSLIKQKRKAEKRKADKRTTNKSKAGKHAGPKSKSKADKHAGAHSRCKCSEAGLVVHVASPWCG